MNSPQLDVKDVAKLARLQLSEEEITQFQQQLGNILEYVEQLNKVDLTGVEPMAHANPVYNVTREDASRPGLGVEKALSNAPQKGGGLFLVTKVIE